MVKLKVLPGTVYPGTEFRGNFAVWRGRKGTRFAARIGKRRRDLLVHFVERNTRQLPVEVLLTLLDRCRPYAAYPILLGNRRNVGFVAGQFFVLIEFEHLKSSVQETVGEVNFTRQEIVDLVCS